MHLASSESAAAAAKSPACFSIRLWYTKTCKTIQQKSTHITDNTEASPLSWPRLFHLNNTHLSHQDHSQLISDVITLPLFFIEESFLHVDTIHRNYVLSNGRKTLASGIWAFFTILLHIAWQNSMIGKKSKGVLWNMFLSARRLKVTSL